MDLVINHTAQDAVLAADHPEWYRRNPDGTLYAPRAIDPDDPTKVTIWEDLAELDYETPSARAVLIDYWTHYVRHYAGLGFDGFRCDAAYQVPAGVWRSIISAARQTAPDLRFFAETLGCTADQVVALADAGFDYIFNSAKWWDFRAPWLLDQYERFRLIAPSIAFPESHDTERLAAEVSSQAQLTASLKFHLLFAACFSTGLMVPMGYEYGFRRRLDVVRTRPEDWEETGIDLTEFVSAVHAMKAAVPALNREGHQRRITAPDNPVVGLLRLNGGHPIESDSCAIILLNPDPKRSHQVSIAPLLAETGGMFDHFADVTPLATPLAFHPGDAITLEPLAARVFRGDRGRRPIQVATEAPIRAPGPHTALDELAANRIAIERVHPELDGGRFPAKRIVGDMLEIWADIFGDGHDKLQARIKYRTVDGGGLVGSADGVLRQRPLDRAHPPHAECRLSLHRRSLARPVRQLARRSHQEARRRAGSAPGAGGRPRPGAEGSRAGAGALSRDPGSPADPRRDLARAARGAGRAAAGGRGAHGGRALRRPHQRIALSAGAAGHRRPAGRPLCRLVRADAALAERLDGPPRHLRRCDRPPALCARDGLRRALSAADPPDRAHQPQGPQQQPDRRRRTILAAPMPSAPRKAAIPPSIPELGSFEDFKRLLQAAHAHGLEIALDFAIQCSPDHPWIKEHPEWFDWRPDGTIKFAENPPKKYEDIVNLHFYRDAYPAVWHALRDVVLFWIEQGVKIFRVDNPHTKPLPFWEWMIGEVRRQHPDVIFLAEAFTRPKMMKRLAKLGFTQSYTYFTWRTTKRELTEYLTELTQEEPKEYYRPNFFANTPDINPLHLQTGGRAGLHRARDPRRDAIERLWAL